MSRDRKTQVLALGLLAAVVLAIAAMRSGAGTVLAQSAAPPVALGRALPRVRVASPERRTIHRVVRIPADILAFESAMVHSRATGYVREIPVDIGSRVAKGEVLAVLDVPDLDAAVTSAQGGLAKAAAAVGEAKAALAVAATGVTQAGEEAGQARSEVARAEAEKTLRDAMKGRLEAALRTSPNLVAEDTVEEAVAQARIAEAKLDQAQAAVRVADARIEAAKARLDGARAGVTSAEASEEAARGALDQARAALAFATVRAPFDGIVAERKVDPGDLARGGSSGSATPIARVVDLSKVRVRFRVAETDVAAVAPGRAIRLTVDALPGREFTGAVARVAGSLDLETRTMVAEGDIPNADGALRDGLFGRATVDLEEHPNAIVVPASAVTTVKRKSSVLVVEDGKVAKRSVRLGADDGISVEIVDGLKGGEAVITAGAALVSEGDAVEGVPAEPGR